jgi:hypothetical protein
VFLLGCHIIERPVLGDRTTQGDSHTIAPKGRLRLLDLERIARVEGGALYEEERVAVNEIRSGARDHVDRAARRPARFRRKPVVDDLKFLDDFR